MKLGSKYDFLEKKDEDKSTLRWIELKRRGNLRVPSEKFFKTCQSFEQHFLEFHGETVNLNHDPIGTLCTLIKDLYPEWPDEVIKLFVKVRFFHRIKVLNRRIKMLSNKCRDFKQKGQFLK